MADPAWPGIRPGAQSVDVYNEGLLVYLLDEANLPVLEQSGADFQSGFAEDEADVDPQLKKLAKDGIYGAYELIQDDEVSVEIVVGPPLTKKELAVGRWHKPQKAFLRLPSGKLRVDTPNTLPIHDEPTDPPGVVNVPPGDYVLTLYRLHWDDLRNDGLICGGEDGEPQRLWHGPQEVIVLTPLAEAKPVRGIQSYLRFPQPDSAVWKGKYEIEGQTFRGLAMTQYWWDNIHVNLDCPAQAALGLQPGMSFRLELKGFVFDVIFYGDAEPVQTMRLEWAKALANGRPEFGVAFRLIGVPDGDHYITFPRVVSTKAFPTHERWLPATLTLSPERYELPALSKP